MGPAALSSPLWAVEVGVGWHLWCCIPPHMPVCPYARGPRAHRELTMSRVFTVSTTPDVVICLFDPSGRNQTQVI